LVDRLATQIWEIRDDRLHLFKGTYSELVSAHEIPTPVPVGPSVKTAPATNGRVSADKQARKQERRQVLLEGQIAEAETAVQECSSRLHRKAEGGDLSTLPELSRAYEEAQLRLEELLSEWTDLAATP
jgi:hypothetical protein